MQIIHCLEYDSKFVIGGSVKYAQLLDEGLTDLGYHTKTYSRGAFFVGRKSPNILSPFLYFLPFLLLLLEILVSWNPLVNPKPWIVHHPVMGFLAVFARKHSLSYVCHGPWFSEGQDLKNLSYIDSCISFIRKHAQRFLIFNSCHVFFLSDYMRTEIITSLSLPSSYHSRFSLIPPIVDRPDDHCSPSQSESIGSIYICRRLVERTGVLDFVHKLSRTRLNFRHRIYIAGDGPDKPLIDSCITANNLGNCIMLGFVDDETHRSNFIKSDYMLLPSLCNEGFGLVIVEAIKHSCIPIVSIHSGGGKDWLSRFFPQLIYDGSISGLLRSIDFASRNRLTVLRKLTQQIQSLNSSSAARTIVHTVLS